MRRLVALVLLTTLAGCGGDGGGNESQAGKQKKGLSLSEVARGAGLSRRELVSYERGKLPIPESDLWVLAGSCGVET